MLREAIKVATNANSNQLSEFMEKVKGKDLIIESMTNETR
jgi:hypothetical protein